MCVCVCVCVCVYEMYTHIDVESMGTLYMWNIHMECVLVWAPSLHVERVPPLSVLRCFLWHLTVIAPQCCGYMYAICPCYIHGRTLPNPHLYTHTHTHKLTCTHTHTCMQTCTHIHTHSHVNTHTCTCTHTLTRYARTLTCTHTHIHTGTHVHKGSSAHYIEIYFTIVRKTSYQLM